MDSDAAKRRAEPVSRRLAADARADRDGGSDDKRGVIATLARLSPLIQGVLLAAVGTVATIIYNERQLQLTQLAALDKYRVYLASDNPQERIFGYEAFVALGQERFVIRLIGAKQDAAGEHVLTTLAKSANDEATRKEAQTKLEALLADAERQRSLGRHDTARESLDTVVQLAPENEAARLQRDTLEDWRYLVKAGSKISSDPYLKLAKHSAQRRDTKEARSLLERAAKLFADVRVLDILIEYNPAEIDMNLIRDSLTLEAQDQSWNMPPGFVKARSFLDGNHLLMWTKTSGVNLHFNRYGYDSVTVQATTSDLQKPEFVTRRMTIRRTAAVGRGNVLQGRVRLENETLAPGVTVSIRDDHHENRGFKKTSLSESTGAFAIEGIPDGRFEIHFEKAGYVSYGLPVTVKQGAVTCLVDARRHYSESGIAPCDLGTLDLQLYRARSIKLDWMLQENATARHFRDSVSSGQVQLSSALRHDWTRGGWGCCRASFKFGSRQIDAGDNVDLVVFTDTDGQIYFAQPHNTFITEAPTDYDSLVEIPAGLSFNRTAAVKLGKTYVLYTSSLSGRNAPRFFAKIRVVDMN